MNDSEAAAKQQELRKNYKSLMICGKALIAFGAVQLQGDIPNDLYRTENILVDSDQSGIVYFCTLCF